VPEPKTAKNRLYIDLLVHDVEVELVRLESFGALRLTPAAQHEYGQTWYVVGDLKATNSVLRVILPTQSESIAVTDQRAVCGMSGRGAVTCARAVSGFRRALLEMDNLWRILRDRPAESGVVMVVSLATFDLVASTFGIPGVDEVAEQVRRLVRAAMPSRAAVGYLGWTVVGAFLPGQQDVDQVADLTIVVKRQAEELALELLPGEWADVRLAVGSAVVREEDNDVLRALLAAASEAQADADSSLGSPARPVLMFDENARPLSEQQP
jgi:GGDEF domain-containing protein